MDKQLVAYAYLAQTTKVDGDLLSGLMPIFKPIASEKQGEPFEAQEFSKLARNLYGLDVSPLVAEDLAPRLEKMGILERVSEEGNQAVSYRYSEFPESPDKVTVEDIENLLDEFINYIHRNNFFLHIDPEFKETAKDFFLDYITDLEFAKKCLQYRPSKPKQQNALSLKKDTKDEDPEIRSNTQLGIACSLFVYHSYENSNETFSLILKLCTGSIVSQVVFDFQNPQTDSSLKGVTCVLDTPFLMNYMGLSDLSEKESAESVCDRLNALGASLSVYDHTLEELKFNMRSVYANFQEGKGYRATARRLNDPAFKAYFNEVKENPKIAISSRNISIIKTRNSVPSGDFETFETETEKQLYADLVHTERDNARKYDVKSVNETINKRGGARSEGKNIQKSKVIFLTGNSTLADKANKSCRKMGLLKDDDFPLVVTDRKMASYLWVLFGGENFELPKRALLANCSTVTEPNDVVISEIIRMLNSLDDDSSALFKALMTSDRASRFVTEYTMGEPEYITDEKAMHIVKEMKQRFSIENQEELKQAEDNHQRELETLQARMQENDIEAQTKIESIEADLRESEIKYDKKSEEINSLKQKIKGIQEQQQNLIEQQQNREIQRVNACISSAKRRYRIYRVIFISLILFLFILGFVSHTLDSYYLALTLSGFGLIGSILTINDVFDLIHSVTLEPSRDKYLVKILKELDLYHLYHPERIDWKNEKIDSVEPE